MSEKLYRQQLIRDLISENEIQNQDELILHLNQKNIVVTQATLSRDLRELKISKFPNTKGLYIYQFIDKSPQTTENITSLNFSGNMAVLKTQAGFASRLAIEIDLFNAPEIVGSIAGDDTIFMVLTEKYSKEKIFNLIQNIIPNLKINS